MNNAGQNGSPGRPATRRHWATREYTARKDRGGIPVVQVDLGDGPYPNVQLTLGNLAARRLLLALGMGTRRYGPEVKAVCDGLATLLVGTTSGKETAHPHGPGHDCPTCRLMRPLHEGSRCCNPCFWETPEQFMDFPTICPHRAWGDN